MRNACHTERTPRRARRVLLLNGEHERLPHELLHLAAVHLGGEEIFEVDPLVCPRCSGPLRSVRCITPAAVIGQILTHLRTRAAAGTAEARCGARSPPSPAAPVCASTFPRSPICR